MRIAGDCLLAAPIDDVWSLVTDPEGVLSYMSGVTRSEGISEQPTGLSARYRMLFRVGAAEVGGLVEVVEFDAPCDFAWTSVTGLDHRGRWRLREAPGGRTHVELRLSYVVAGAGLSGWSRTSSCGCTPPAAGPQSDRSPHPDPASAGEQSSRVARGKATTVCVGPLTHQ